MPTIDSSPAGGRLRVSAVIITLNAEAVLEPCLQSLFFADEVVVVDSGSRDRTVAIAESFGARVVYQEWLGYGRQKQFAVDLASYDWVLCVDADERVSDVLREHIERCLNGPLYVAYRMARRNCFMGRWLAHGEGYPDYNLRLFDRRYARWSDDVVHEHVVTEYPVGTLPGDLVHYSQWTLADYLAKQNHYTTLQARYLYDRGLRASVWRMVVSPMVRFVKFYFVRRGFLDGVPGLVHISIGCFNSFCKYAKLYALQRHQPRPAGASSP